MGKVLRAVPPISKEYGSTLYFHDPVTVAKMPRQGVKIALVVTSILRAAAKL